MLKMDSPDQSCSLQAVSSEWVSFVTIFKIENGAVQGLRSVGAHHTMGSSVRILKFKKIQKLLQFGD